MKELESSGLEPLGAIGEPWYNPYGDCVHLRISGDAYYGQRIDEFLTIYRHVTSRRPIGFQIKGIAALIKKLQVDGLRIEAEVGEDKRDIEKVSLSTLLLLAYDEGEKTPVRLSGYTDAIRSRPPADCDDIDLVSAAS
ncbi:MAG: hypothetical protein WD873_03265 [Candidatus Hydrogenedentales bacterium]